MKKTAFYFLLTAIALMFVACEKGDDSDPIDPKPPIVPEVDEYFYFMPTSTQDTAKWNTESDSITFENIPSELNSTLVLNYTFDNTVKNTVAGGVNSEFINTSGKRAIKVDKTEDLCFEKNFTLSAWVKLGYTGYTTDEQTIISKIEKKDGYNPYPYGYKLSYADNTLIFYVGGFASEYHDPFTEVTCDLRGSTWQLITAVWENDSIKLYVDGILKNSETTIMYNAEVTPSEVHLSIPVPTPANDYNLYIGNSAAGDTPFKGSIDQVMVFDTDLDASEVEGLFGLKN